MDPSDGPLSGLRLLEWRRRRGLPQERAATKLGVSLKTYRRYELGRRKVPRPVALLFRCLTTAAR